MADKTQLPDSRARIALDLHSLLFITGFVFLCCTNVMADDQPSTGGASGPAQKAPKTIKVNKGMEIDVIVKNGSKPVRETVLCGTDNGKTKIEECRKSSDSSSLTRDDVNMMALQKYFPRPPTKHSYTNQSGPQTFHCDDLCTTVCQPTKKTIKTKCGIENGLAVYCIEVVIEEVCTQKCTHTCECTAGCYD